MALVSLVRPRTIVELGTHMGDSYCAFCQAVAELNLESRATAIDTWEGDSQAGDQLAALVLSCQKRIRVTDFLKNGPHGFLLFIRMPAPILEVGHQF